MEAPWDTQNKRLDDALTPANPHLIHGIKALSRRSFKLLKDRETRYNWQDLLEIWAGRKIFP